MESKTKHRLLGILVVVGLVVILLPFMQSGRESSSTDTTTIKVPAFPDQSVQVETPIQEPAPEIETKPTTEPAIAAPEQPVATTPPATSQTEPQTDASATEQPPLGQEEVKNQPDDAITAEHPVEPTKAAPPIPAPEDSATEVKKNTTSHLKKKTVKQTAHNTAKSSKKDRQLTVKNNDLFNIQEPSWVIQVGDYSKKAQALKVVNQLRAKGYRAFIQQFSTTLGANTRVFVGPENKQADARQLASELNSQMKLHGIVISYKPLAS